MEPLLRFFVDNFPSGELLLYGVPASLAYGALALAVAAFLKRRFEWKTGYSRKTFHFLVFGGACFAHTRFGTPAVCLYGGMVSLIVLFAILKGAGHAGYDALARDKDAPYATYYIIVPWAATAVGGILANAYLGRYAVIGYLVGGIADAIAEPVGTRWGRHRYRPPFGGLVESERSLEGSLSVALAAILATSLGLWLIGDIQLDGASAGIVILIAILSALVEAISPHGWDNLTMQFVPAFLASWLFPLVGFVTNGA